MRYGMWISAIVWVSVFCSALPAHAEKRLALVIGQTEYTGDLSRIEKAEAETDLIAGALGDVGFAVRRARNLTKSGLSQALRNFRLDLENAGADAVGFVYYTGHGAQHPRTRDSYLLGVDTQIAGASDLPVFGLDMATQRDGFAATGAKAVFLVFDACRNLPGSSGFKANNKGLNAVAASADMLIAYATDLGDVAAEGIYAPILAAEIRRPGQNAEAAFVATQKLVAKQTNRDQLPWTDNRLYNEVCFAACKTPARGTNNEAMALGEALTTRNLEGLQAFLARYPNSSSKSIVQREIAALAPQAPPAPSTITPIDFGDDTSDWANDGECDDKRFSGPSMTSTTLIDADIGHDASDCEAGILDGSLTYIGLPPS